MSLNRHNSALLLLLRAGVPPNSSGMPSVRTPILRAASSSSRAGRFSGYMPHSFSQSLQMKRMTNARMLSLIDRARSIISCKGFFLSGWAVKFTLS
jgi:hypothetical protein